LKILHVYRTYFPGPPGGLQEAIRQICLATGKAGVENTIFTLSKNPVPASLPRPEGQVIRGRSWCAPASCDLGGISAFRRFAELASSSDIVHYQFPWPFADLLHKFACPRIPAVMTYHSDIVRQRWLGHLYAPLMRETLNAMSAVVATSPAYAKTSPVLSRAAIQGKVSVIPLGIDENSYSTESDEAIFDRLGLTKTLPFFLFIGVLRYYKGLHTLIHAAQSVNSPVVIAGAGPEERTLRRLCGELKIQNVHFAGQVTETEKIALLRQCHALVLPSHLRSEAFGMVLVEAAMFGKPLLSCEIGTGTSFVNQDQETGFVVPPEDPSALARAMNILLEDAALTERFGIAARARYEQYFSGPALGQAYHDLYQQILH
jgi:rhamnosyl/mannosyltransferase